MSFANSMDQINRTKAQVGDRVRVLSPTQGEGRVAKIDTNALTGPQILVELDSGTNITVEPDRGGEYDIIEREKDE